MKSLRLVVYCISIPDDKNNSGTKTVMASGKAHAEQVKKRLELTTNYPECITIREVDYRISIDKFINAY